MRFISTFKKFYLGLFLASIICSFAEGALLKDQYQAGFYRIKIGGIPVIALSDGTTKFEVLDGLFLNTKRSEVEHLLSNYFQRSPIDGSVNAFLIELGSKFILVDVGSGELLGPTLNKLPESLKAVGISREDIRDIFLTHLHPDHAGGLTKVKKRLFPNATIHLDQKEFDYWTRRSNSTNAHEPFKTFFSQAHTELQPYLESGQLSIFHGPTQFFPEFRSEPAYGHTPGHSLYILEKGKEKILFCGDLIHVEAVQFDRPSLSVKFDSVPAEAVRQRERIFSEAARDHYLIAAVHLSFPGIGYIKKTNRCYRWIPVQFINDQVKK